MAGRVWTIAVHTFKEAIRDRILVLLLVFAVLMIGFSIVLSWLTVGSELKIVTDLGLATIALFGMLIAVFSGITLVHKEVERKTIYNVLSKPVPRWLFLVGKYAGLMLTIVVVVGLMSVVYVLLVAYKGGGFPVHVLPQLLLTLLELSVVTAVALMFSTFTTPVLAAVFTLGMYVAGRLSWALEELMWTAPHAAARWTVTLLYYALPDLYTFNVRAQVVHGEPVGAGYLSYACLYGVAYTAGMLVLAVLLFRRRDLT